MCPWRHVIVALAAAIVVWPAVSGSGFAQDTLAPEKKPGATAGSTVQLGASTLPIAVPTAEVLLILVRNSIAALNQANFTGNYTVLRDLGSPSLQKTSAAELGIAFANLRQQGVDLSPVLILTPALTEQPAIAADGALRLAGHFPTRPLQINFVMTFQPVDGIWRLHGLSVNTAQVQ